MNGQPSANRTRANELVKGILIERYARTCQYCFKQSDSYTHGPDGIAWAADHIVPTSKGGSDDLENRTLSCASCNCSKRDRVLADWQASRAARPTGGRVVFHPARARECALRAYRDLATAYHLDGMPLGEIARAFRMKTAAAIREQVPAELIVPSSRAMNVTRTSAIRIIEHLSGIGLEDVPPGLARQVARRAAEQAPA